VVEEGEGQTGEIRTGREEEKNGERERGKGKKRNNGFADPREKSEKNLNIMLRLELRIFFQARRPLSIEEVN
jgi:hypothetical protein